MTKAFLILFSLLAMPVLSAVADENTLAVHPILHSAPHAVLPEKPLDPAVFKKLNGCLTVSKPFHTYDNIYERAEFDAASQFCEKIKGLSKGEIFKLAGRPYSTGHESGSEPLMFNNEDNWLFIFGFSPLLVRAVFSNDTCIDAWFNPYNHDDCYQEWRKQEIANFAVGKTKNEILKLEGPPSEVRELLSPEYSVFDYWLGELPLCIYFQNDRCTVAEERDVLKNGDPLSRLYPTPARAKRTNNRQAFTGFLPSRAIKLPEIGYSVMMGPSRMPESSNEGHLTFKLP